MWSPPRAWVTFCSRSHETSSSPLTPIFLTSPDLMQLLLVKLKPSSQLSASVSQMLSSACIASVTQPSRPPEDAVIPT